MSEPSPEEMAAAQKKRGGKKGRRGDLHQQQSYVPDIHRLLPAAPDAERGILGSILLQPDILDEIRIADGAFHIPSHAILFEHLTALRADRKPIDFITLTQRLRDRNVLEEAGGASYVTELFTFLPTAAMAVHYADIVEEKRILRETIKLCTEIAARSYEEQDDGKNIVEDLVTRSVEIAAGRSSEETIQHVGRFAQDAMAEIEYAYDNRGRTVGIATGFVDFDRMTGGWQKGYTYYFGARPAMGKSSLGLNFAIATAASAIAAEGCPTLFFSVEMTGVQLAKRLIFTLAEINQQHARDGFLSQERDWTNLTKAAMTVANSRLFIDETAALTIADFRARARRWIKKIRRQNGERTDGKPDGMIWIDYLQRMKGSSKRSEDARYLELQEIAQGISQTAKELGIPIGVLAQLKRPKDKKPDTEPDMTEFRECGDIEQEAHVVALIHRPHYYVKGNQEKQEGLAEQMQARLQCEARARGMEEKLIQSSVTFTVEDLKRYAKLIIDKQREGPVGPIDLRFIADYTKFETWDGKRKLYSNNKEQRQVTPGTELEEADQ